MFKLSLVRNIREMQEARCPVPATAPEQPASPNRHHVPLWSGGFARSEWRRKLINIKLINMGPLFRDTPRSIYINSTLAPRCDPAHRAHVRILV